MRRSIFASLLPLALVLACAHEPGPPPEPPSHLDAPPHGDVDAGPPAATIDIAPGDDKCPVPIHPGYCNFRCRGYTEREAQHHAQRIADPKRWALGTCGSFKVFAEEEKDGGGIVEIFDGNELIAAQDSRSEGCKTFLMNDRKDPVKCTLKLEWHE